MPSQCSTGEPSPFGRFRLVLSEKGALTVLPGLGLNSSHPASASQAAGTAGGRHCAQLPWVLLVPDRKPQASGL